MCTRLAFLRPTARVKTVCVGRAACLTESPEVQASSLIHGHPRMQEHDRDTTSETSGHDINAQGQACLWQSLWGLCETKLAWKRTASSVRRHARAAMRLHVRLHMPSGCRQDRRLAWMRCAIGKFAVGNTLNRAGAAPCCNGCTPWPRAHTPCLERDPRGEPPTGRPGRTGAGRACTPLVGGPREEGAAATQLVLDDSSAGARVHDSGASRRRRDAGGPSAAVEQAATASSPPPAPRSSTEVPLPGLRGESGEADAGAISALLSWLDRGSRSGARGDVGMRTGRGRRISVLGWMRPRAALDSACLRAQWALPGANAVHSRRLV
jgi:hypothetical protein